MARISPRRNSQEETVVSSKYIAIEEIDDQEVGDAPEDRGIDLAERPRDERARQLRPGAEGAEDHAEEEGAERDGDGHQRRLDDLESPSGGAEADQIERAHQPITA